MLDPLLACLTRRGCSARVLSATARARSNGALVVLPRRGSLLTLRGVRSVRERLDAREELRRLPVEQPHGGQELRGAEGSALGAGGADDRAPRELRVEEARRLGQDPV